MADKLGEKRSRGQAAPKKGGAPKRAPKPKRASKPKGAPQPNRAPGPKHAPEPVRPPEPMRIAKAMAHAGLCSRRDAEKWIEAGRVAVNGKLLTTPAHVVGPADTVTVDGEPLPQAEPARLWRYNKPKGLVTSHKDPLGRKTVFEALPGKLPRVVSVGRLDINTEGLLLLTTDGALARHLELPSTGWVRRYRVRVHGRVTQEALDGLKQGVTIDGVSYGPVEATLERQQGTNQWLMLGLREGKNREVKRIAEHLGLTVNRLIRVSFGPFALGDLAAGMVEEVKPKVVVDQLGEKLAAEFGLRRGQLDRQATRRR